MSTVFPGVPAGPEASLMKLIFTRFHEVIDETVKPFPLPAAFVGALIADESGGDPMKKRFEPKHFAELLMVLAGQRTAFDSTGLSRIFGQQDILRYVVPDPSSGITLTFAQSLQRVVNLASSWGVTQIMGWHFLEYDRMNWLPNPPIDKQMSMTMTLLSWSANRFHLDMTADFEKLFACWNCGLPDPSKTFDPNYVKNGMARMALYDAFRIAPPEVEHA